MSRIRWTRDARRDASDIWHYIARDNIPAADAVTDGFTENLGLLAQNPLLGSSRSELGEHVRSFSIGNYILFCEPVPGGILLVRILHGARDIPRELRS